MPRDPSSQMLHISYGIFVDIDLNLCVTNRTRMARFNSSDQAGSTEWWWQGEKWTHIHPYNDHDWMETTSPAAVDFQSCKSREQISMNASIATCYFRWKKKRCNLPLLYLSLHCHEWKRWRRSNMNDVLFTGPCFRNWNRVTKVFLIRVMRIIECRFNDKIPWSCIIVSPGWVFQRRCSQAA